MLWMVLNWLTMVGRVATVPTQLQVRAKLLQVHLPWGVGPPWLQAKCNLSIPQHYKYHVQAVDGAELVNYGGQGGHSAHPAAN